MMDSVIKNIKQTHVITDPDVFDSYISMLLGSLSTNDPNLNLALLGFRLYPKFFSKIFVNISKDSSHLIYKICSKTSYLASLEVNKPYFSKLLATLGDEKFSLLLLVISSANHGILYFKGDLIFLDMPSNNNLIARAEYVLMNDIWIKHYHGISLRVELEYVLGIHPAVHIQLFSISKMFKFIVNQDMARCCKKEELRVVSVS